MSQEAPGAISNEAQEMHSTFWDRSLNEIRNLSGNEFKNHELPLARIKKIMKLDEEVKMISAEAPVLFSKAAEIFISELSLRAWIHTEENKRRTLQRNDIAMAITKYDQFDFLIDIVPREEIKSTTKRADDSQRAPVMADQVQYIFQLAQQAAMQSQNNSQSSTQSQTSSQPVQLQLGGTNIPAITIQPQTMGETTSPPQPPPPAPQPQVVQVQVPVSQTRVQQQQQQQQPQQQQPQPQQQQSQTQQTTTQVFQQVLTPSGDVQNIPIQLTPEQIQAITLQMQGKQPGQPILIQTSSTQVNAQEQQQQQQAEQVAADQSQFSSQPLFQVPLNLGGQQVYIQQAADGLHEQGAIEIQDS